jgi:hypothetical protein
LTQPAHASLLSLRAWMPSTIKSATPEIQAKAK